MTVSVLGEKTFLYKELVSMFLLYNSHNKSSFDHSPTLPHANHNNTIKVMTTGNLKK